QGDRMPLKHWLTIATAALVLVAAGKAVYAADPTWNPPAPGPEFIPAVRIVDGAGTQECPPAATDFTVTVSVPHLNPGLEFHAGILVLQPSADNLGYAVLTVEKNFASPVPLAQPFWQIQTLEPSYQPGFEVGAGYAFANCGNDVRVNWQ